MNEEASGELGCHRRESTEQQKDSLGSTARHGKFYDNLEETDERAVTGVVFECSAGTSNTSEECSRQAPSGWCYY